MNALRRAVLNSLVASGLALALAAPLSAQGVNIGFPGLRQDSQAPIEVTSDNLSVNQQAGGATFEGNVVITQGEMKLSAAKVDVEHGADGAGFRMLRASGGVTLVTASDAAESQSATYEVATGALVMSGAVLLTQGEMTISGDTLRADLRNGTGRMEGRVKTLFQPRTKN